MKHKRKNPKKKYRPWKNLIHDFYLSKENIKTTGLPKSTRLLTSKIIERTETFILLENNIKLMKADIFLHRLTDKDYFKGKTPKAWDWNYQTKKWEELVWIKI